MKKILKEQITEGPCASKIYLYNPGATTGFDHIDNIVATYGPTATFGDYYGQKPNQTSSVCCVDENGVRLGRTTKLHSNSPGSIPPYAGQINATTWKQFIDQMNAVHQANNLPTNYTYSDTWTTVRNKTIAAGAWTPGQNAQFPVGASGICCVGCTSPVQPPGTTQAGELTPDEGMIGEPILTGETVETKYECADKQCIPDPNGTHNTLEDCQKDCYPCTHGECFHCSETAGACTTIGSQWSQALVNGVTLYNTLIDCENNEPTCAGGSVTDKEECHCCKKNADGTSTLTVMPGLVSVGKCDYFETTGMAGSSQYGTQQFSGVYHNCAPVTQTINCGDKKIKKTKEDIREDIQRMKRLIRY